MIESSSSKFFSLILSFKIGTAVFCFKLVSPSKLFVSTFSYPSSPSDLIMRRSAGKFSSFLTRTTWPTLSFQDAVSVH
jgi:hypothetical protein